MHQGVETVGTSIVIIQKRLTFLRRVEALKSVVRSAYTSTGRQESTAEHSWRLCLMAMAFEDALTGLDMLKVLKMCLIHDLGEAVSGDVPAVFRDKFPNKEKDEKRALGILTDDLDETLKLSVRELWGEYEAVSSAEAAAVKALDKLETLLQHNQGLNPSGFDYIFNLSYGKDYMQAAPLFEHIRAIIDHETKKNICMNSVIRSEQVGDVEAIRKLTKSAFSNTKHTSQTEHFIIDALRRSDQLALSLVALDDDVIVGHVAISPVVISSGAAGWFGLGPISVWPERQGYGIGAKLVRAVLAELQGRGAAGCVVLGDPVYYGRFGFKVYPELHFPGVPQEYFQAVCFSKDVPRGAVSYQDAFNATE